jgi:release factor glutamine methyltransferase
MITIGELRREFRAKAAEMRLDPRDVDLLLTDCLGRPQSWLLAHGTDEIAPDSAQRFSERMERRFAGEPIQYIRSRAEFYGREFTVDRRVLIPRPETELLVEAVLQRAPKGGRVLDVGTGSGCIAITLKLERPDLRVYASDIFLDALDVARSNASALEAAVDFVSSDLLSGIRGPLDVVVSNPPYIPVPDLPSLQTEVRDHEPHIALGSGADGLDAIRRLIPSARERLLNVGILALEIGFGQAAAVAEIAGECGWPSPVILKDLAGIDRVVVFRR